MNKYNHQEIEKKWQNQWLGSDLYQARDFDSAPKKYVLDMFPYPSGQGLHVGHPEGYTATDIYCRYLRYRGFNVLHPMGWDAFGLPAENYAIKTGTQPKETTANNVANFKKQIQSLGLSYDWSREVDTTDPNYYRWTQWIFLQLFKRGLAYEAVVPINWCPSCLTGLANEEVVSGKCDRCHTVVVKKDMKQWLLKITAYAGRLLMGVDHLDWPDSIKALQRNWIGRSVGAKVQFRVQLNNAQDFKYQLEVFTTRPDTLFGVTFMVLAPEHELVTKIREQIINIKEVENYIQQAKNKSDLERTDLNKDKTGVELQGCYAINPVNGEQLPIWLADYVLAGYGTGAIMSVPAHDQRDWEFAKKYNLPIVKVVENAITEMAFTQDGTAINSGQFNGLPTTEFKKQIIQWLEQKEVGREAVNYKLRDWVFSRQRYWGEPIPLVHCANCREQIIQQAKHINFYEQSTRLRLISGFKTVETRVLNPEEPERYFGAIKVGDYLQATNKITKEVQYCQVKNVWQFKDLPTLFNNQEVLAKIYAPDPLPKDIVELERGYSYTPDYLDRINKNGLIAWEIELVVPGIVPVPEDQLPITLPEVKKYEPTGTGESPLATITDWVKTTCLVCGQAAKRETNTMPQWAGSSWYWLRFIDPHNNTNFAEPEKLKYWLPVDMYVGGAEHAVLHLLYSRFWNMVLFDLGLVPVAEPFQKLINQGLILGPDGEKMSKSRGNVINPDDIIQEFGADTLRLYEMFMGPLEDAKPWDTKSIIGVRRFLDRIYNIEIVSESSEQVIKSLHKLIKKVGDDIENFHFNTAISAMMIFLNDCNDKMDQETWQKFLIVLSPLAPHLAEEMWSITGHQESIFRNSWPVHDSSLLIDSEFELVLQINGKVRDKLIVSRETKEKDLSNIIAQSEKVQKYLNGSKPQKIIYIPGRLVNIVL